MHAQRHGFLSFLTMAIPAMTMLGRGDLGDRDGAALHQEGAGQASFDTPAQRPSATVSGPGEAVEACPDADEAGGRRIRRWVTAVDVLLRLCQGSGNECPSEQELVH